MPLDDSRLDRLISLIRDSFRVERNNDPVYVDVGGHLDRVKAPQHQVIYGRRGSGKSCLLVTVRNQERKAGRKTVYFVADEIKTLSYPDVLIRLLLGIFEELADERSLVQRLLRTKSPLAPHIAALRRLLQQADVSAINARTEKQTSASGELGQSSAKVSISGARRSEETEQFMRHKLDTLNRNLQDYKAALVQTVGKKNDKRALVMIDDFYLIHRDVQPDVVDYLHRLLRGTGAWMKIGTVRHRTKLGRTNGQFIGIEPTQDVEVLNLDLTFGDMRATTEYLAALLDSLGKKVGIPQVTGTDYLNENALFALTLSSGGVPRDFLEIFVNAIEAARNEGRTRWLTQTYVYRGAGRVSYQEKLKNLRSDTGADASRLEAVFSDLLAFCLREKRKTAFLIAQDDVGKHPNEHDLIEQLMDFKVIHVVAPDTSAASGRAGRYEAYTLDAASFMEPRRRGIEIVEFWKTDEQRRPVHLREAPDYPLDRIAALRGAESTETVLAQLDRELPRTESAGDDDVETRGETRLTKPT